MGEGVLEITFAGASRLKGLLLPRYGAANAVVCLGQWRDSNSKGGSYDRLSETASTILKVDSHLHGYEIEDLVGIMTFLAVEKRIASALAMSSCDVTTTQARRRPAKSKPISGPRR